MYAHSRKCRVNMLYLRAMFVVLHTVESFRVNSKYRTACFNMLTKPSTNIKINNTRSSAATKIINHLCSLSPSIIIVISPVISLEKPRSSFYYSTVVALTAMLMFICNTSIGHKHNMYTDYIHTYIVYMTYIVLMVLTRSRCRLSLSLSHT